MQREHQPYVTVPNSEGLNMDEERLEVLASPPEAGLHCDGVKLICCYQGGGGVADGSAAKPT